MAPNNVLKTVKSHEISAHKSAADRFVPVLTSPSEILDKGAAFAKEKNLALRRARYVHTCERPFAALHFGCESKADIAKEPNDVAE